jgi:hypothetical protein
VASDALFAQATERWSIQEDGQCRPLGGQEPANDLANAGPTGRMAQTTQSQNIGHCRGIGVHQ